MLEIGRRGGEVSRSMGAGMHPAVFEISEEVEIAQAILAAETADVIFACRDGDGKTILHRVIERGMSVDLVELLVAVNLVLLDTTDGRGKSVFHSVCRSVKRGYIVALISGMIVHEDNAHRFGELLGEIVDLAPRRCDFGRVCDEVNDDGNGAIHLAAMMSLDGVHGSVGRECLRKLVLLFQANVGLRRRSDGRTVGHIAVEAGNPELLSTCLDVGLSIQIRDRGGYTVTALADLLGRSRLIDGRV